MHLTRPAQRDRQILIELLHTFYRQSSRPALRRSGLKFLVTSRPYPEIEEEFQRKEPHLPMIRLQGELENDRIHHEINLVIRERLATLAKNNNLSRSREETLRQKLLEMKHRTYLWLHLAFGQIENALKRSLQPNLETIDSLLLPVSIEDAYEKILTRVLETEKKMVINILHIIVGARRSLTISEMAMALRIFNRRDSQSFDQFRITEDRLHKNIRDLTGLFVFVNHSKIYLIHQTAKEFLLQTGLEPNTEVWKHSLNPNISEKMMARICVEYLSLSEIYDLERSLLGHARSRDWTKRLKDALEQSTKIEKHEIGNLLAYSSEHWAAHFRDGNIEPEDEVVSKVRDLCRVQGDQFPLWFSIFWRASYTHVNLAPEMNDLMVAAFNGHEHILRMILDSELVDVEPQFDVQPRTALMWASDQGHDKIVKILLGKGANTNYRDHGGEYALSISAHKGHEDIAKMLLQTHAEMNGSSEILDSALLNASERGNENIARMLLDKGADVNLQRKLNAPRSSVKDSPPAIASLKGHENIVRLLLERGADVNARSRLQGTALEAASTGGHEDIVRLLLDRGADVNARSESFYDTALHAASTWDHENIMSLDGNVDAQGESSHAAAIHAASTWDHENMMSLDGNVDAQGESSDATALHAASEEGRENIATVV